MRFESAIEIVELESERAGLLPERESLNGFSISIAPVIVVQPVTVVGIGNVIAVQVGTINSTLKATLNQMLTV
jgi:hypothetical protein